jgi:hypothetical protein
MFERSALAFNKTASGRKRYPVQHCHMELFYWILVFGLFTVLLGGALMAVVLSCTLDHRFRLIVRVHKRTEAAGIESSSPIGPPN